MIPSRKQLSPFLSLITLGLILANLSQIQSLSIQSAVAENGATLNSQQFTLSAVCAGDQHVNLFDNAQFDFSIKSQRNGFTASATGRIIDQETGTHFVTADRTEVGKPKSGFVTAFFEGPKVSAFFPCSPFFSTEGQRDSEFLAKGLIGDKGVIIQFVKGRKDSLIKGQMISRDNLNKEISIFDKASIDEETATASFGKNSAYPYTMAVSRSIAADAQNHMSFSTELQINITD